GISKDEFLRFLESHRATPNGVFGMKMHHDQLARLCRQKEAREAFLNRFDRVILVSRRNKLAQAISYARAMQTQHWEAERSDVAERARRSEVQYDFVAISRLLGRIVAEDQTWRDLLAACRFAYRALDYEELIDDFPGTMAAVARFLGIEGLDRHPFLKLPL